MGRDDASDTADAVDDLPQSLGADSTPTALAEADSAPQVGVGVFWWSWKCGFAAGSVWKFFVSSAPS